MSNKSRHLKFKRSFQAHESAINPGEKSEVNSTSSFGNKNTFQPSWFCYCLSLWHFTVNSYRWDFQSLLVKAEVPEPVFTLLSKHLNLIYKIISALQNEAKKVQ
jgi:hypothetical protein